MSSGSHSGRSRAQATPPTMCTQHVWRVQCPICPLDPECCPMKVLTSPSPLPVHVLTTDNRPFRRFGDARQNPEESECASDQSCESKMSFRMKSGHFSSSLARGNRACVVGRKTDCSYSCIRPTYCTGTLIRPLCARVTHANYKGPE